MGTPGQGKYSVSIGSVLVHSKWKGTQLSRDLKAKFNNVCWRDIGFYDFCLYGDRYVIYVPESDLVTDIIPRKFTNINKYETVIVIGIRNAITAEQFAQLQDLLVITGNKKMIPVGDACEIPDILQQLSYFENTPKKASRPEFPQMHLGILLNVPGLGKLKAEKLLNNFGTIHKIASSSVSELSGILGLNLAREVYKYFHS